MLSRFLSFFVVMSIVSGISVLAQDNPVPVESSKDQPVANTATTPEQPANAEATNTAATPNPTDDFARNDAEAEGLGAKNKAFMEKFYAFRELNKKLNALKVEYPEAKPARQTEIDKEYWPIYNQGIEIFKELFNLGFEAFDETPNRNPFVNNVLYGDVEWEFRRENYEKSVETFKRLASKGIAKEAEVLYVYAGLSALLTMNLDEADAWLKIAIENGYLTKVMENLAKTKKGQEQVTILQSFYQKLPQFKESWAKEQEIRKAEKEAGDKNPSQKLPRIEMKTSKGTIVIELFENEAPNTVANFISLVEKGFYNGTPFHRVLPLFMAQGGDPTGSGMGGPGYGIDDECGSKFPKARKHFRGSLSMANAGPNTNGSQFFLTFVPTDFLDGRHTVFGCVVEGMEVLSEIQRIDPQDEEAMVPSIDKIEEAKVLNKRNHDYVPVKNGNR